jgi:hypothetical protein
MGKSGLVFTPGPEYMGRVLSPGILSAAALIMTFGVGRNSPKAQTGAVVAS